MEGVRSSSLQALETKGGCLPAVNSQLGFHVKGHVPTIKEAEESRDTLTQWGHQWRISSGNLQAPGTTPSINTGVKGLLDLCESSSMPRPPVDGVPADGLVEVVGMAQSSKGVRRLVKSVVYGLKACQEPEASLEGLGGTYFFMNEAGKRSAIVKPCDEEPLAPCNPKGFVGRSLGDPGLKPSVRVGEAAMREVAAFLLDHEHFASVPHTVMVKVTHNIFHRSQEDSSSPMSTDSSLNSQADTISASCGSHLASSLQQSSTTRSMTSDGSPTTKLGSLQEYVYHDCDTSEMGASRFAARDVHRIGILDIRIWNTDRHAGNILVRRQRESSAGLSGLARLDSAQLELVPIDHGFCLPESLEPPYFEWLHWPQAMIPFSEDELDYIARLDAEADMDLLRRELPSLREESLRTLQVATILLQRSAAAGLTLAEIGALASRPFVGMDEEPSELERLCLEVRAQLEALSEEELEDFVEDEAASTTDTDEECIMAADQYSREASNDSRAMGAGASTVQVEGQECSSSRVSSGTLYAASGSYELPFLGSARLSRNTMSDASRVNSMDPSQLLNAHSSRSGEDLLFDLDEERYGHSQHGGLPAEPTTPSGPESDDIDVNAQHLVTAFKTPPRPSMPSPGAFSSVSDAPSLSFSPLPAGFFAIDFPKEPSSGGDGHPCMAHAVTSPMPPPMARSLAVGGGGPPAMWAHVKEPLRRDGRERHGPTPALRCGGRSAGRRHARPYKTPEGCSLFGGLDAQQWGMFIAALEEGVQRGLAEGHWKQAASAAGKPTGLGVSCPHLR